MMKKGNLGFTLVELLAVIIVLGVILVITSASIINIVDIARKGAFKNTAYGIIKSTEYTYSLARIKGERLNITYIYNDGVETSIPENSKYKLNYRGEKPKTGKVIINNKGDVGISIHNGKWCAVKNFNEVKVQLHDLLEEECLQSVALATIELVGEPIQYVSINTSYTDQGAIAKTIDDEPLLDIQTEIKYQGQIIDEVTVSRLGNYEITYMVEYQGYKASVKRTVVVEDKIPPDLIIPSNITLAVEEVQGYNFMEGVSVSDNSLETITVTLTSDIIPYPGEYTVVYSASDSSGNTTTKTRYITIIDVGYPVISILGSNPVNINVGNAYTDAGATALDDVDGDITEEIKTTSTVNVNIVGTYIIKYTVSDKAGNETIATRTLNVIDNVPPTITFGTNGNSTYAKSHNSTVNVADTHGTVLYRYYQWTTSTTTPASFTTTFTNGETLSTPAGVTGGYYLWIKGVDNSGNEKIQRSNVFNLDNTIPTITFGTNGNATYAKVRSTTVNVADANGTVASRYYQWTTSTTAPASFTTTFTNGANLTSPAGVTGGYYLWIKGVDNSGNEKIQRSNVFNLDNTGPLISGVSISAGNITTNSYTITRSGNASDAHSALATNPYIYQTSLNGSTWTTVCTNNTTTCNITGVSNNTTYYYRLCANDSLGNQSCLASKTVKTNTSHNYVYYTRYSYTAGDSTSQFRRCNLSGGGCINIRYDTTDYYQTFIQQIAANHKYLYYSARNKTNLNAQQLYRCNLDGSNCIIITESGNYENIIAGTSQEYFYYAKPILTGGTKYNKLYRCNLEGTTCTNIASLASNEGVVSIAANQEYLYYSVHSASYKDDLYRCNLDGTNCANISSKSYNIYVATNQQYLFYQTLMNSDYDAIYRCNLDGSGCSSILQMYQLDWVSVNDQYLYTLNYRSRVYDLRRCDFSGNNCTSIDPGTGYQWSYYNVGVTP